MQLASPLRPAWPCASRRATIARSVPIPGVLTYPRRSGTARRALSSSDEDAPSLTTALLASNGTIHAEKSNQTSTSGEPVADSSPEVAAGDSAPTAAPTAATPSPMYRDWLPPAPGDWGGTVDLQGIKEPDSYGVLFYFIIIAGLSVGVHQLTKLAGQRRPEQHLMRLPQVVVAVAAAPRSRGPLRPALPPSTPEASTAADTQPAPSSRGAESADAKDQAAAVSSAQASREGGSSTEGLREAAAAAAQPGPQDDRRSGSADSADGEATPAEEAGSEETSEELSEPAESRLQPHPAQPQPQPQPQLQHQDEAAASDTSQQPASVSPGPSTAEGAQERAPLVAAASAADTTSRGTLGDPTAGQQAGARGGESAVPPAAEAAERGPGMGFLGAAASLSRPAQPPAPLEAPSRSSSMAAEAPARQAAQPGPGPGSTAPAAGFAMPRMPGPFGGASFFGGGGSSGTAAVAAPEPAAPPQLSLPAVRPEPLSRAPDSSALAHLPTDSSLPSLRERAQLALRAAASASEASQRAAAYAAASSSAASRAAEAAERAATAAAVAQAGLETATESAIVAAEARVAQAQEAAKEAEWRAASAAAHATAYQDMSQLQADIAERASTVTKPAPPGPLSQLQQLWRSASSAFTHGHHHDQQDDSNQQARGSNEGRSQPSTSEADEHGDTGGGRGGGAGSRGSSAAETIKGFLTWLGQGDGTR